MTSQEALGFLCFGPSSSQQQNRAVGWEQKLTEVKHSLCTASCLKINTALESIPLPLMKQCFIELSP